MSQFKAKTELNINKVDVPIEYDNTPEEVSNSYNDVYDFAQISIDNLSKILQSTINSRTPFFIWSRERQNEKIRLDNEKQNLILDKISILQSTITDINQLKADIFFSAEYINNLIADKKMRAEHYFQLAIAQHKESLTGIKVNIDLTNSLVDHDQIDKDRKIKTNQGIDADNAIKLAQARKLQAEAENMESLNELRKIVMSKIDFDNFPHAYISDLVIALSGVNMKTFSQFEMEDSLNKIFERMENAKARKAEAEVDDFMNSAEFRKWKNDKTRRDGEL